MNFRVIAALAVILGLALGFAPAFGQGSSASGTPRLYVTHNYVLTELGYGVVSDNFTFTNNGTAPVQIPTLQVGFPPKVSARVTNFALSPSGEFSLSQSGGSTGVVLTVSPVQATLNAGANISVGLEGEVSNVLNFSSSKGYVTGDPVLVLLSPSLNVNVTRIKSNILLPSGDDFNVGPKGFSYASSNGTYYKAQTSLRPVANETYLGFNITSDTSFTPISLTQLTRTIVPASNGAPTVEDKFTIHNLASYNITELHLDLLNPSVSKVTVLPSTEPPMLNPTILTLSDGNIVFQAANIGSVLFQEQNVTLTITYPLPSSVTTVSGSTVKVTVPLTPILPVPLENYTIVLAKASGITPVGQTSVKDRAVNAYTQGSVSFTYDISVGWAAGQAIPAGVLLFAVAFAMFAIQKPTTKAAEGEKAFRKTSDVLRAFEEKTGLETQYMSQLASAAKGSIGKTDFDRMKNEVNELRSRAIQRLTEMKQTVGPGRQSDALTKVAEGEKEEDRAFRDLLNLYIQYHGNRMNEETFRRLLPNYKKRVDTAINQLSDLLHTAQTEEK